MNVAIRFSQGGGSSVIVLDAKSPFFAQELFDATGVSSYHVKAVSIRQPLLHPNNVFGNAEAVNYKGANTYKASRLRGNSLLASASLALCLE